MSISIRNATDEECKEHGFADVDKAHRFVFLVCEWKQQKAFLVLRMIYDQRGRLNSEMAALFPKDANQKWFLMRERQIHKAANRFAMESADVVVSAL